MKFHVSSGIGSPSKSVAPRIIAFADGRICDEFL